jgi:hypothetical protein
MPKVVEADDVGETRLVEEGFEGAAAEVVWRFSGVPISLLMLASVAI